ncbi:MAG: molybdenum cofactor guanylyltransferase [Syntrophobacterales bacterium]|nr:molybdenum cofactor guanylyltransferase [Syntrophobacterales bacterium]
MIEAITGVILAGGRSSRFGRNKALEHLGGERFIDRSIRLMRDWCRVVFVVCQNLEEYFGVDANLIADIIPNRGPLGGLYTALLFSPKEWVFLRAVDMPFLERSFADFLIKRTLERKADVVIPLKNGEFEPLCACYNVRCIPHIKRVIESGGGRMIQFFQKVRVDAIPEETWRKVDSEGKSFVNVNTLKEFEEIVRAEKGNPLPNLLKNGNL